MRLVRQFLSTNGMMNGSENIQVFFYLFIFYCSNGKTETVRDGDLYGVSEFPLTEKSYQVSETVLKNKSG